MISEVELPEEKILLKIIFDIDQLIISICESMEELINQKDIGHTETQFKNIDNWLGTVLNIMKKNLLVLSDDENDENVQKINAVLLRILRPYEYLSNLIPFEEKCISCIQECVKIIYAFHQNEVLSDIVIIQALVKLMVNFGIGK